MCLYVMHCILVIKINSNSGEVAVNRNISYETGLSHSTSLQATQTTGPGAAAEYSRIGPSYETTRRQLQPAAGRNQVSARLSERYEFSDTHLAMISAGGGTQGEAAMDYEEPLQCRDREDYSHLQH